MPKIIELTVEIVIQKVSCPGVWLCQDGGVSLIVFALGTSYETCMLPPTFPLLFNDKLYFRKRFHDTCALNNICCVLKDETLYCELVQWGENCGTNQCNILAQYLGSLSEVLFPPNMCCSDGVDLLMRRSKKYPGILAPKIEITTKVRIDEVWNDTLPRQNYPYAKTLRTCHCSPRSDPRQKPVCHSTEYHRTKCSTGTKPCKNSRTRSHSHSGGSGSCNSLREPIPERFQHNYSDRICKSGGALSSRARRRDYCVYNVEVPKGEHSWTTASGNSSHDSDDGGRHMMDAPKQWNTHVQPVTNIHFTNRDKEPEPAGYQTETKILLESRCVDEIQHKYKEDKQGERVKHEENKLTPCLCDICRRYHELFHDDPS